MGLEGRGQRLAFPGLRGSYRTVPAAGQLHLQNRGSICSQGFPGGSDGKESACNEGNSDSILGLGRSPWRRKRKPTPVFLPGEAHGRRSLAGSQSVRHD